MPHLEITKVIFPKSNIFSKSFIFIKTFNLELSYIEVWFTDQNYKPLEIEDKTNIALVIN